MSLDKLWDQIEHDLGFNDHSMQRNRPYNGQPHTSTGMRGSAEIKGITLRDLRDCYIRAILLSTGGEYWPEQEKKAQMKALYEQATRGPDAVLCENDLYGFDLDRLDPMAVFQNLACEVERIMGIYPNVPELQAKDQAS